MNYTFKFLLKVILIGVLFVFIIGYSYYKTKDLIGGVKLTVAGIEHGETVSNPLIELSGTARRAIHVRINGREIFIDSEGIFRDSLLLLPGYNIITIEAQNKFGKEVQKTFEVFLEQDYKM